MFKFSTIFVCALAALTMSVAATPLERRSKTGDATWSYQSIGACGIESKDTDFVVGVSATIFDAGFSGTNPNKNPICKKQIKAYYTAEGSNVTKSVIVTVRDRNPGAPEYKLNLSPAAFKNLAPLADGVIHGVHWDFI